MNSNEKGIKKWEWEQKYRLANTSGQIWMMISSP
jgi:predicted GIY-YIG superfamily endonuclease